MGYQIFTEVKLTRMEQGWEPDLGNTVVVDPVIGAHTGPGMVALIYWGNNR